MAKVAFDMSLSEYESQRPKRRVGLAFHEGAAVQLDTCSLRSKTRVQIGLNRHECIRSRRQPSACVSRNFAFSSRCIRLTAKRLATRSQ